MSYHNALGQRGEAIAVQYLKREGYEILARNFRYKRAEIDLIAFHDDLVVIVEVKTRNSNYFGDPQRFVSPKKIRLMVMAADAFVCQKDWKYPIRFDIVAVLLNSKQQQITHIKDAFYHF
jgi:putative endonuclease